MAAKRKNLLASASSTAKLEQELQQASQQYYSSGTSPLSDVEFDNKLEQLKELNPESNVVLSVGHGYAVAYDDTYGVKRKHAYGVVGSLDKVHNWDEFSKDLHSKPVVCSLKLDGISCALYYTNGTLDYALTRGDGTEGFDITAKLKYIAPDMFTVKLDGHKFTGAIRGELVMKRNDFKQYLKSHADAKNARNTVAGLINQKEASAQDLRLISLAVYSVIACDSCKKYGIATHFDVFAKLSCIHETAPFKVLTSFTQNDFDFRVKQCHSILSAADVYPQDGLVIADQSLKFNKDTRELTWNAQAYKFAAESKQTTVQDVVWTLTKTGYYVPKVKFNAIELSGTTVQYATAFNAKYVQDNHIKPGCKVTVTKSGEIIPYIVSVDYVPDEQYTLPRTCKYCGKLLHWVTDVHIGCCNVDCFERKKLDAVLWIKTISSIDGLSDTLIRKYCDTFHINCVSDLYQMPYLQFTIAAAQDVESKIAGKQLSLFAQAVDCCLSKSIPFDVALTACNIPRIASKTASKCTIMYFDIMEIAYTGTVTQEQAQRIANAIGHANFESLVANAHKLHNLTYIHDNLTLPAASNKDVRNVCVTGKLSMKRKDFEQLLAQHSFAMCSSVTKSTFALITDNPNSGSRKNSDADKLGIPKYTESEFTSEFMNN